MNTHPEKPEQLARWWIWIAVGQFVVIFAASVAIYPENASATNGWLALHLYETTYCDLGKFDTENPRSNHYLAMAFNASMVLAATGFIPHWWILPRLFPSRRRMGRVVRVCGFVSVAGMFGVGPTTGDGMATIHGLFISCAGIPGLVALIVALAALTGERQRFLGYVVYSWLFTALALFHFCQHIGHFWMGMPWNEFDYAIQKIAILAGLGWVFFNAVANRRAAIRDS